MRNIFADILKDKRILGLQCHLDKDGEYSFTAALLERRKNKVALGGKFSGKGNAFLKSIPKGIPVILNYTGKGVLFKKTRSGNSPGFDPLSFMLPGAEPSEFYVQSAEGYHQSVFASVVRKTSVDTLIHELVKEGAPVLGLIVGPFSGAFLLPLLSLPADVVSQISVPGYLLSVTGGKLEDLVPADSYASTDYMIGEENIPGEYLLAFASALKYIVGSGSDPLTQPDGPVGSMAREHKEKKKFKLATISVLTLIFSLLLINYLFFDHYSRRVGELSQKVNRRSSLAREGDSLRSLIALRETVLQQMGMTGPARQSYYADQIAMQLPSSIRFKNMEIAPVKKINEAGKESLVFMEEEILLSGTCSKNTELSSWMEELKNKQWVNNVSLVTLSQDKAGERAEFSIKIELN